MIAFVFNLLAALVCFACALRLLTFRRGTNAHNYCAALSAWLCINALLIYGLWLLARGTCLPWALINCVALVLLAIPLARAKGNIKALVWIFYKGDRNHD